MSTTFKAEQHGAIEVGIIEHEGREFSALGSVVTGDYVVAYKKGTTVTTWAGDVLGTCRVVSTWKTPRSYVSTEMHQLEAVINGVRYRGRCAGDGMIFRGRRKRV
jgi:hypothetical protein